MISVVIIFRPITGGFLFVFCPRKVYQQKTVPFGASEDAGGNHTFKMKTAWLEGLSVRF